MRPGYVRAGGQITVFFALTLSIIFALLLGILESARTQGARLYFTQAVNSGIDSLFSQYHRSLWKQYRLLGLEHYAEKQLCDELERFITPYFGASDWYPETLTEVELHNLILLTDLDGEIFEKEVLDYMHYGMLDSLWDYLTAEQMLKDISEAVSLDRVSGLYQEHTKEAVRLEETLEALMEELGLQQKEYEEARSALEACSGNAFIRHLKAMKKPLGKIPGRVRAYEEQADRLAAALEGSRRQFEEEAKELSDPVAAAMEQDIREYEAYVRSDGERRQEIEGFVERSERNLQFLDDLMEEAREVQDRIDSWDPEEDGELSEEDLWRPVKRHFQAYDMILFGGALGVADKEKEGFLEAVRSLLQGSLLELLLPEGVQVSKEALPLTDAPSLTCFSGENGCRLSLTERVLMGEYALKTMNDFSKSLGGSPLGSGSLEIEYILKGKESDHENLSETVLSLLAMREGLNLIYLFTDTEKRNEARALAAIITGAAGFPPLITVMTFFILGVWALGQSLCDLGDLLAGKKVPFMHGKESFYLSLEGLLSLGQSGGVFPEGDGGRSGLPYREYLRILLFKDQSSLYDYRMMDMIQMNVKSEQKDFLLNRCVYSLELKAEAETKHVLASLGMLSAFLPMDTFYTVSTESFRSY